MMRIINRIQGCAAHDRKSVSSQISIGCFSLLFYDEKIMLLNHSHDTSGCCIQVLNPKIICWLGNQGKIVQRAFGLIITWHCYTQIWWRMTAMTRMSSVCQFYDATEGSGKVSWLWYFQACLAFLVRNRVVWNPLWLAVRGAMRKRQRESERKSNSSSSSLSSYIISCLKLSENTEIDRHVDTISWYMKPEPFRNCWDFYVLFKNIFGKWSVF